jgi:hypothetical protein
VSAKARALLGKQVVVTLGPAVIVEGRLLGFGEGGEFEVLCDDGFVHYCWPMLDIEDRLEAEARGTLPGDYGDGSGCYVTALGLAVHGPGCPHEPGQRP